MADKNPEIVRVLRIIEYVGPRAWVEDTVSRAIHGTKNLSVNRSLQKISAATIGEFPEILTAAAESYTGLTPKTD